MIATKQIRRIYAIVIGAFAVAMGIALICVCADIYYSGRGTGVVFTREIVVGRLKAFVIPFILLIGAIAVGAVFPLYEVKAKPKAEDALRLLGARKPSGGEGNEYAVAQKNYRALNSDKFDLWLGVSVIVLVCVCAVLTYLLDTANFMGEDITAEIFAMVRHVLPWVAVAFGALVVATVYNGIISTRQVKELKTLIKHGNGAGVSTSMPMFVSSAKKILNGQITLWVVRGVVFVVGVTFIALGAVNGGARDVMIKAVNICTECIGLG